MARLAPITGDSGDISSIASVSERINNPALLLSVDFEDWHQLVRRRVGARGWGEGGPALARQTHAVLDLLDELGARATFFVLGMAARSHPQLVEEIAARGHELGSHGDAHQPIHGQTPDEFRADLIASVDAVRRVAGRTPRGYRAPAFSLTRSCRWAFDVLADVGFAYDASMYDSPRLRQRITPIPRHPYTIQIASGVPIREFPVAVWHLGAIKVPIGGGTYWGVAPTAAVLRGLHQAGEFAGLYLHPHECDPETLHPELGVAANARQRLLAAVRSTQRNLARRRVPRVLRAVAERFDLIAYEDAYERLGRHTDAGPQALSPSGRRV